MIENEFESVILIFVRVMLIFRSLVLMITRGENRLGFAKFMSNMMEKKLKAKVWLFVDYMIIF